MWCKYSCVAGTGVEYLTSLHLDISLPFTFEGLFLSLKIKTENCAKHQLSSCALHMKLKIQILHMEFFPRRL